jgi:arylsulfatase A-like enzyme
MLTRRHPDPSRSSSDRSDAATTRASGVLAAALVTALATLASAGCSRPAKPNVILISLDALRADHLGCYGHERDTSPNLDRMAAEGTLFERGFSPTAWTLPGHASMLSGRVPRRHGATRSGTAIREDVPLLTEILSSEGYATAAVVNAPFMQAKFGFGRGFDSYAYVPKLEVERHQQTVLDTLERHGDAPFFFFFHYMSVHDPYAPEERFNRFVGTYEQPIRITGERLLKLWRAMDRGEAELNEDEVRYLNDLYAGGVLSIDARIGEILDLLEREGLHDDTIVIVTADHGEEFMEHGSIVHTKTLYDELLHVPLILRGPGVPRGVRVRSIASLIDIAPTVLALVGLRPPSGIDGIDLATLWSDDSDPERLLEIETSWVDGTGALWGIRTPTHKLIVDLETGEKEYYDLVRDPGETENLYPHPGAEELEARLNEWLREPEGGPVELTPEDLERLGALGYVE